jgi:hypothetical protein
MNAADLIVRVQQAGGSLSVQGDKLRISGRGNPLPPELLDALRHHKTEIILTLTDAPTVARHHGLTVSDLEEAAGPDWPEVQTDPSLLGVLAEAVATRRMRERGEIPPHYTAITICRHCGPVPIYPGVADQVEGCPWCFNRAAGRPAPLVAKPEATEPCAKQSVPKTPAEVSSTGIAPIPDRCIK